MSHFNSINQRSVMGKPPAYYKDIGKLYRNGEMMKPPDLKLLNEGSKDYVLRF